MTAFDDIFERSFERAVGNGSYNHEFISRFYDLFLARSEQIARLFENTNMAVQKTMLHDSLHLMLDFYRGGKVNADLERVANVHSRSQHDIPDVMYEQWLISLLQAVQEFDPEYDDQVEQAWREVLRPGIQFMQYRHDPAASA